MNDAFTSGGRPAARSYPERVAWIWLSWYVLTIWEHRHRVSLRRQLCAVLRNAHRIRAFAYLSPRDPGPALAEPAPVLRQARAALRHRLAQRAPPAHIDARRSAARLPSVPAEPLRGVATLAAPAAKGSKTSLFDLPGSDHRVSVPALPGL